MGQLVDPGPQNLADALAEVDRLWVKHDIPMAHVALPGISAEEVRAGLADVGLTAPDELVTWFGWHNGYNNDGKLTYREASFIPPWWCLLSLEQAVAYYKESREVWAEVLGEGYESWAWTEEWFPFAESVGADTLVISCAAEPSASARVTLIGKEGRNETLDPAPSLFEAVKLLLRLAEAGNYRWNYPGWKGDETALGVHAFS